MRNRFQHTTAYFEGAGKIDLFLQSWTPNPGEKKKPATLAFVHGFAEHSDRYIYPVEYFVSRGYTVYAMDLRGHGKSEGRRAYANSLDEFMEDIQNYLEDIQKEKPKNLFLIGHSFGGQLVLNYAARNPQGLRGVIASSPNIRIKVKVPWIKQALAPLLSEVWPTLALGNEVNADHLSHDPKVVEDYKKDKNIFHTITTRLGNIILQNQKNFSQITSKFSSPCLLLHGSEDQVCDPEGTGEFYEKISVKDKTLKIYNGLFHELFNETEKEAVFADMEKWIEKRLL